MKQGLINNFNIIKCYQVLSSETIMIYEQDVLAVVSVFDLSVLAELVSIEDIAILIIDKWNTLGILNTYGPGPEFNDVVNSIAILLGYDD
jgi:hypothetical protein